MKVDYIKISEANFSKVFDFPISELDFVLGGIRITENGKPVGSSILYKNPHLAAPNNNALLFGYFTVPNLEVATQLLNKAEEIAIQNELNRIIGPINGSTWYNYRLMNSFENNPFLGEELTPIVYNEYLELNDFKVFKSYTSNKTSSSLFSEDALAEKEEELKKENWTVRSMNKEKLDVELSKIAQISNLAFSSNFLFSPIKTADFIEKYTPLMNSLSTEYIWLIENQKGELQALMLAYENAMNPKELVLKTTARIPNCKIKGLGTFLTHKITQQAKENGLDNVIHAYLSSDDAAAISTSEFETVSFRKYHLYYKDV